MSTLVLVLLRENHIILTADRRHTRGDLVGTYKNDAGVKTMVILSGRGVLGFSGHDVGEQIVIPAKNNGELDGTSLEKVAGTLTVRALKTYQQHFHGDNRPPVEFLLAGFDQSSNGMTATSYSLCSPSFTPVLAQFPYRTFEIIGRSQHGALYALHRFGEQLSTVESDLALSVFVLSEVLECDTTVGGLPDVYVIRRGERALPLPTDEVLQLSEWAKATGLRIGKLILEGPPSA